jgi:hypothetical protein
MLIQSSEISPPASQAARICLRQIWRCIGGDSTGQRYTSGTRPALPVDRLVHDPYAGWWLLELYAVQATHLHIRQACIT